MKSLGLRSHVLIAQDHDGKLKALLCDDPQAVRTAGEAALQTGQYASVAYCVAYEIPSAKGAA